MTRILVRNDKSEIPIGHADPEGVRAVVREELHKLANHIDPPNVVVPERHKEIATLISGYLFGAPREPAGEGNAALLAMERDRLGAAAPPPGVPMVPEDAEEIRMQIGNQTRHANATVDFDTFHGGKMEVGVGLSPALALCIAALRARRSQGG